MIVFTSTIDEFQFYMCFKPSSGSGGLTRCVCSSPIRTGFQDPDMPPPPLDGEGAAATATAAE